MEIKSKWPLLIPAVFAVSWAAILIRACDAPSTVIAFYRKFFATLILLPFALTIYRQRFYEFTRLSFLMTVLAGILLGWHFFFWVASLGYTSISSSVVLVTTQPVFVAVLALIFLKEKIGFKGVFAIVLAIIGSAIIAGFDFKLERQYLFGDILALAGAIMAGGYLFIGRAIRFRVSVFPYIFTVYSVAALTLGIILLVSGEFFQTYHSQNYLFFILLAVGPTLLGHSLYNYSLQYIKAHKVGLSIVGEPVLASIWAIFIFNEIPALSTLVGGIIIILALVLVFSGGGQ